MNSPNPMSRNHSIRSGLLSDPGGVRWFCADAADSRSRAGTTLRKRISLSPIGISPDKTKSQLDVAIVRYGLRDCSELGCIKGPVRYLKLRRICDIKEFSPKLQLPLRFGINRNVFEYRE